MDSRTAFMAHATMVMICAVMLVHPFEFVVIESIGGLIAISSLRELSQRSQLFKTAIFIALSMMAVNLAFDWMRTDSLSKIDYSIYTSITISSSMVSHCCLPIPSSISSRRPLALPATSR